MLGLPSGTVTLSPYDPSWPGEFERERARLAGALGDLSRDIVHVGSTAVPGMVAKPLIDVMVGLGSLGDAAAAIQRIEALGYSYKGEFGIPDRHFFVLGEPTTHHVHVVFHNGPFWRLNVLFRDYLRAHPDEARQYEALKRSLAAKFASSREEYTKGKDAFIKEVLARAGWAG